MEEDPRFASKLKDPKFKRIPKNEQKVKIDKRFKSMFENQKFQVKYTVDKRGRPFNHTSKEDLKRYYDLSSGESSSEEDEANEVTVVDKSDKNVPEHVKLKLKNLSVDYARGESALFSESSSDDEEESEVDDDDEFEHAWGELDRDAERTDEVTHRLAACNMDWDRIKAVDLMMVLSSFLPSGGVIRSVTIYPSEFGLKRMQEEELKGPLELVQMKSTEEDGDDGSKFHMEKLRKYQLNRLKYYYAVIVCDSKETANKLYTDCDGVEYESSSTKLDLRFVPDEESFDQEAKEVCEKLPEQGKYQPRYFTTTALQQAKVDLTWDETDPDRVEVAEKLAKSQELDNLDLKAYLASSSGEEEEDEVEKEVKAPKEEQGSVIDKYKALLQEIEDEENAKKQDVEMEITWGVGFKEKAKKLVKKTLDEKVEKTPFEKYLDKRKEKRKLKKEQKKKLSETNEDDDEDVPSDIDMNDPYFAEEFDKEEFKQKKKGKAKKVDEQPDSEEEKNKAELELLLSNDDGKNHFSLQKIQQREDGKVKKKSKKKPVIEEKEDDFQLDIGDDRFSALYTSHHFNIDPTDSHYKKTKGIEAIISEKLKRRIKNEDWHVAQAAEPGKSSEMNVLVKSLKRRTEDFSSNKKKKLKSGK